MTFFNTLLSTGEFLTPSIKIIIISTVIVIIGASIASAILASKARKLGSVQSMNATDADNILEASKVQADEALVKLDSVTPKQVAAEEPAPLTPNSELDAESLEASLASQISDEELAAEKERIRREAELAAEAQKPKENTSDSIKTSTADASKAPKPSDRVLSDTGVIVIGDKRIEVKFNRSFMAKLIQASDDAKSFYAEIKNHLLSLGGVKSRVSWKAESFSVGRKQIARLTVKGKTLNINLALDPANYTEAKFKVYDKSESKTYASVPLGYKITSKRACGNAKRLIDDVASSLTLTAIENTSPVSASDYPFEETKALIEKLLIKLNSVKGEEILDIENVVSKPFSLHESVTVEEAHEEITDEVALTLVVANGGGVKVGGKRFIVNIDTLSANFAAGETVDIDVLKARGIVPKKEKSLKILARGTLDKALTVIADSYSADAIKMIVLVGGTAKLK